MRIRASYAFFLFAAIAALFPLSASGQVATGNPPFASFGGGPFDTVNLANLNVHFGIPVISKAGRGIPFSYTLVYDSSVWYPVGSSGSQIWTPVANFGWAGQTQVSTGYVSYISSQFECFDGTQKYSSPEANGFQYHDPFGAVHPFVTGWLGRCDGTTATVTATDGSGYTIDAGVGEGTIHSPSGQLIYPPLNSPTGSGTSTDRNGNQITVSGSTFTDTLGTTALTISGQGTHASPLQFQYTAPNTHTVAVTLTYTSYNVKTAFQCSGISEYNQTIDLVSSISLPDGTSYSIQYEPTPNNSGFFTGRIHSITLPTGGTITYTYSGGSNGTGILCADGSTATLTRQTPDGTWTYAHSESGTAWTTLVTDPQSNQTNMNFQGIYETERQSYQGSSILLKTLITCYNGNTSNCNTTAITLPITQRTVTLQWPGGKQSKGNTLYNSFGLVTENDEYDYGNGAPGGLLRQTLTTYAALGNNISNRPATVTVKDGSGIIKAQTTYSYDQGTVTTTSGTPQHASVSGSRGNATTISSLVQGSTTLSKTFTYYDTGTVATTTDVNGALTTYTYGTGSCGNSFVTSVALPLSLTSSQTWNCTGGIKTSATDANGKTTTFTYTDPDYWRITSVTDAASNVTNMTYNGATSVESSLVFNGSNSTVDVLKTVDSLGRTHVTQRKQSPSANFDSVESDFDNRGMPNRATLPYSGTAGQTNSSGPSVNATYDALGRKTQSTDAAGRTVTISYSQNDTYLTIGPAPTGEHTKQKQLEYDGLGRLTSVCEITSMTGSGTCAQTSAQTGFWTKYTFDVLGNLTGVTQNAQSGSSQTRSYSYDGLGRLTSETNPESGTQTYVYDTDSTCGTSSGDLVKRTDAVGNTACYAYDALHRSTSVTYSGPYAANTPNKYFVYDSATVNSVAMSNAKSRMAEAYTATCSTCSKLTDLGFSHTVLGQPSDVYESTQHSGGYYHVTASYWAHGALNQLSNLTGLPTITYNVDGEGRVYSVSASSGQNPLSSTIYNVAGKPTQVNLGSSDSDAFTYDPNTNRMTQYKFNVNGQSVIGNLGWNADGSLGTLGITDPFNSNDAQSCSYSNDDLSRIASANCGTGWSQTFAYDAFGNIGKSGTMSFQPTYSYLTNRMTQIGSSTPTYDANGNVTNDFLHTYTWNAAGRPVTIDAVGVAYDALNRMVEQNRSGTYSQIVYSPTGAKLAIMNGQSLTKAFVPLPAGSMAIYNSSGLAYYRHSDWVGSSRFASTPSRAVYFDGAYAPFGEPYAQTGTADLSFTGMNQDTVLNLYDFPAREYGIQGRWPSPDPSGLSSVSKNDPQTWNRYAYVRNSPLIAVDPQGLRPAWYCHDGVCGGSAGGFAMMYGGAAPGEGWGAQSLNSPYANPNDPMYSSSGSQSGSGASQSSSSGGGCDYDSCFAPLPSETELPVTGFEDYQSASRSPDFYNLTVNYPIGISAGGFLTGSASLEIDNNYNSYIGAGPNGGLPSPLPFAVSFTANWLGDPTNPVPPLPNQLSQFLTGQSYSVTGAAGPAMTVTYSQSTSGVATGLGVGTPQLGAGGTYSWQIPALPEGWEPPIN
jgi:RHS repeat-associated protein